MMRQPWVQARLVEITSCDAQVLVAGCIGDNIGNTTPAEPGRVEASWLT
jgi:hypothetical protein